MPVGGGQSAHPAARPRSGRTPFDPMARPRSLTMHLISRALTRTLVAVAVAATVPATAGAQTSADRIADLEKRLEANQRLVEALAERVRQLEGRPATGTADAAGTAPTPALAAKVADLEQQVTAITSKPEEDRTAATSVHWTSISRRTSATASAR
jgi:hypothetical protein